jgi:hypothetical protein
MGSGYYEFLRWSIFVISLLYVSYGVKFQRVAQLVLGLTSGLLWNPVFPIYLDRGGWFWIDLVFAVLFFLMCNGVRLSKDASAHDTGSSWK